jgi:hypothetical protein
VATLDTLSSTFGGSSLDTGWTKTASNADVWGDQPYDSSITVVEGGGSLTETLVAGHTGGSGVFTSSTYDLTASHGYVNVPQVAAVASSVVDTFLLIGPDTNNWAGFIEEAGTLFFEKNIGSSTTQVASATYSATTHAWWRIRESSGTIFADTSPDGVNWTNFGSTTVSFSYTTVLVHLEDGSFGAAPSSPAPAKFANFNTIPTTTTPSASDSAALGDAPPLGIRLAGQYASEQPIGDLSSGLWTPSTGVTLFGPISETTADTSTFDSSSLGPTSDTFEVALGNAPVAIDLGGMPGVLNYQYRGSIQGGRRVDLTVVLLCNGSPVQTWNLPAIQSTFLIAPLQLSAAGLAAIVPGGTLSLRTTATQI